MVQYRVVIDRETCIACGAAPSVCSDVFMLGEDNGKNRVTDKYSVETTEKVSIGVIPEELYECAKSGADICPVAAIKLERIVE